MLKNTIWVHLRKLKHLTGRRFSMINAAKVLDFYSEKDFQVSDKTGIIVTLKDK